MPTDQYPGLPAPPAVGASALPAGTYDGTVVFVTGAGTGLGKAIASEFARLGAAIVIASRKPEHLEAGQAAIEEIGAPVLTVTCDIREPDQIAAAFDAAGDAFGLPGVLINNAAANFPVPAEDTSPNAWRTVVDITLNGTFFCAREFGRPLAARAHPVRNGGDDVPRERPARRRRESLVPPPDGVRRDQPVALRDAAKLPGVDRPPAGGRSGPVSLVAGPRRRGAGLTGPGSRHSRRRRGATSPAT